jgi:tryptophanyl-tRNA synthetase
MKTTKVFSGIKPSGEMTLGNYLGMLKPAMEAQQESGNIFCVMNYHAITVPQDPETMKKRTIEVAKIYLAAGLDLKRTTLFVQSDVPEHTELAWILNCFTYFGEASRQVQFKDKHHKKGETVTVGLFDYPVLMAADILIYDATDIPVGQDQKQHVELCRDIASRFNNKFGEVFVIPKPVIKTEGARIMSLSVPTEKMSKSDDDPSGSILLIDEPEVIRNKFAKAVTDSDNKIIYDKENKPGISNLLSILSACSGEKIETLEKKYQNTSYGELKKDVAEAVISELEPFQKRYNSYAEQEIRDIFVVGANKMRPLAQQKLDQVKKVIGINY